MPPDEVDGALARTGMIVDGEPQPVEEIVPSGEVRGRVHGRSEGDAAVVGPEELHLIAPR